MTLYIKLAIKKLFSNINSSIKKVFFFGIIFSIIITMNLFLAGTEKQMKGVNRNSNGDVKFLSKDSSTSIHELYNYTLETYNNELESVIPGLTINTEINSISSFANGNCISATKEFYSYIKESLGFISMPDTPLKEGTALIEASMAETLNIKKGDIIVIKYTSDDGIGMVNTVDIEIDGIFVSTKLIYENSLLLNLSDMQNLVMDDNAINRVRLYFKKLDTVRIREVATDIKKNFFKITNAESATLDPLGGIMGIFSYYRMLVTFILAMIIIIFLIILNFSNQNLFFMEFRARRAEISTLLTYGMKVKEIRLLIFLESVLLFIFSLICSFIITIFTTNLLKGFQANSIKLADIITVIGGPKLLFSLDISTTISLISILFLIIIYSSQKGANNYLKMEIREIITTAK